MRGLRELAFAQSNDVQAQTTEVGQFWNEPGLGRLHCEAEWVILYRPILAGRSFRELSSQVHRGYGAARHTAERAETDLQKEA